MKNKKVLILGILIGIIMTSGVGVVAAIFNAEDISFTPNDSSWEVTNVKEAMDSLYTKTSNGTEPILEKLYTANLSTEQYAKEFDVSEYYENYQELTEDNFIVVLNKLAAQGTIGSGNSTTVTKKYDPTTGIFKVYRTDNTGNNANYMPSLDIYLSIPKPSYSKHYTIGSNIKVQEFLQVSPDSNGKYVVNIGANRSYPIVQITQMTSSKTFVYMGVNYTYDETTGDLTISSSAGYLSTLNFNVYYYE